MGNTRKRRHDYSKFWFLYYYCVMIFMGKVCFIPWLGRIGTTNIAVFYVVAVITAALVLLYGIKRNFENVIKSGLIPCAAYIICMNVVSIVIASVLGVLLCVCLYFDDTEDVRVRVRNWLQLVGAVTLNLTAGLLIGCIVIQEINMIVANVGASKVETTAKSTPIDIVELRNRIAGFEDADYEEKVDILKAVCTSEAQIQGLNYELILEVEPLYTDGKKITYGESDYLAREVKIAPIALQNREKAIATVLHEVRHFQQIELVNLQINSSLSFFDDIKTFKNEFQNYKSHISGASHEEYASQLVEMDAEEYAHSHLDYYITRGDNIKNEGN